MTTTPLSPSTNRVTIPAVWTAILSAIGVTPTEAQWPIVKTLARFVAISGGEQGGKSFIVVVIAILRFILLPRSGAPYLIWLVGRKYENSKKEWEYLIQFSLVLGWLAPNSYSKAGPDKQRRAVLKDGTEIRTLTIAEEMNIGMERPDIIIGCEMAQASEEGYKKLRARAAASGGHLLMSSTYESREDWYMDLYESWQAPSKMHVSFALPSWSNQHVYPGGREDPEIQALIADTGDEFVLERMSGVPRKPFGLVFGRDFSPKIHVREIDYIPGLPVYLAIDPGYNRSVHAAEAIQMPIDGPIHVFDEIYDNTHTTSGMIEALMNRPWWGDVDRNECVIDIQATARQQAQDDPPILIWQEKSGLSLNCVRVPIIDGIDRFRSFLLYDHVAERPGIVMAPRCTGLRSELGDGKSPITGRKQAYSWKVDARKEIVGPVPSKKYCDAIKAVTYFLVYKFGYYKKRQGDKIKVNRR